MPFMGMHSKAEDRQVDDGAVAGLDDRVKANAGDLAPRSGSRFPERAKKAQGSSRRSIRNGAGAKGRVGRRRRKANLRRPWRGRGASRRVAELKEPRAGSGEHTFKAERTGRESAGEQLRRKRAKGICFQGTQWSGNRSPVSDKTVQNGGGFSGRERSGWM